MSLREISRETLRAVLALRVTPEQERFVASNAVSIAQAHFEPNAWFRAIYAGEEPVGFLLVDEDREMPEYFLCRLMIDARYQRKGYGRRALELLVERVRGLPGATELLVSCVPGDDGPAGFYGKFGFVDTGEIHEGEAVHRLPLEPPRPD